MKLFLYFYMERKLYLQFIEWADILLFNEFCWGVNLLTNDSRFVFIYFEFLLIFRLDH